MKRLLFVDHVNRILGGAEVNLVELVKDGGLEADYELHCACPGNSPLQSALSGGPVRTHPYGLPAALNELRFVQRRLALLNLVKGWLALREAGRALARIAEQTRPDILVSCTNKDHFAVLGVACARRIPSVWWVNDAPRREFFPWPARVSFAMKGRNRSANLVAVSDFVRRAVIGLGIPDQRVTVIRNGVPAATLAKGVANRFRDRFSIPRDEPLIGFLGRFTPWKGPRLFIELAQAWCRTHRTGRFVLVGQAFNEEQAFELELRALAENGGARGRVHFVPFQSPIADVLASLDALVHTSLKPEPFGRVIVEAMAVGVPVVAANAGGVPEIIRHGQDGLLAVPGDTASYLEQLETVLLKPTEARTKLAENGRRRVLAEFTIGRVATDFRRLFDRLSSCAAR